jgi:hypothetical protein
VVSPYQGARRPHLTVQPHGYARRALRPVPRVGTVHVFVGALRQLDAGLVSTKFLKSALVIAPRMRTPKTISTRPRSKTPLLPTPYARKDMRLMTRVSQKG